LPAIAKFAGKCKYTIGLNSGLHEWCLNKETLYCKKHYCIDPNKLVHVSNKFNVKFIRNINDSDAMNTIYNDICDSEKFEEII
jgi:hypothetical protein